MKNERAGSVMLLGVAVKRATMPELYRLAREDPRNLRLVLEGVMAKRGFKNPVSAMMLQQSRVG